jgi:hypothetical protein
MLYLGSTYFVISPEAANAFSIPGVIRPRPIKSGDVSGNNLKTENLIPVALGLSFDNHRSYNEKDHAFQVIMTSGDYDAPIPASYFERHKALGTTTSCLHFHHCKAECYNHREIHPEYSIAYDRRIALSNKVVDIGAIFIRHFTMVAQKLPSHYHKFVFLFDAKESQKLPDNKDCDHWIE